MEDELARARSINADLEDIIRSHWNTIVALRRKAERLQATIDHTKALADEWQTTADYARGTMKNLRLAEDIEYYAQHLRDTVTPPNKE